MVNHQNNNKFLLSRIDSERSRRAKIVSKENWFFYIAVCKDKTLYAGITNDLKKREKTHNDGKGSKYTRVRIPVKIIYSEKYPNQSWARKREIQIKGWTRKKKINLIKYKGLNGPIV